MLLLNVVVWLQLGMEQITRTTIIIIIHIQVATTLPTLTMLRFPLTPTLRTGCGSRYSYVVTCRTSASYLDEVVSLSCMSNEQSALAL